MSKTLTHVCDAVISVPVLKDRGIAGMTVALKNMFGGLLVAQDPVALVTGGYIQKDPLKELCRRVDAIKVDLKG